jgi:predicted nuclease of restriction endonuclease-like (RecB) superfamily
MARLEATYYSILTSLKEKIRNARVKAAVLVNTQLLSTYWEIGNAINEQEQQAGWGKKIVDQLAADLKAEFPDMKGLSPRNLRYMREFAIAYPQFLILQDGVAKLEATENEDATILQRSVAKLPWGHNCTLLDKLKLPAQKLFYATKAVQNGWTRDMLVNQIENGLHKQIGALSNNFGITLPAYDSELALQLFKDPYNFDFLQIGEEAKERDLENALIQHITKMLLELGDGFAFKGRQYRLEAGGKEYFIDLLFYHTRLRRHIVIELKIGEFLPEYISKMNLYLGLIDDKLKTEFEEPAIGLILCKTNNKIIAEYALRDTSKPIGIAEYKIAAMLPENIKGELPTIEEIELGLEKGIVEYKENINPVDARLQAIKEKLKNIKTDEIQTPVSYEILQSLFKKGLKALYLTIIDKLFKEFHAEFLTQSINWNCNQKVFYNIGEVQAFWEKEENLKQMREIEFTYHLHGFKKAGTENFGEHQTLRFEIQEYWYGFSILNHNNNQPFLKKLYHQPITEEDQQQVVDLMMTKVMDRIEWIIEFLKKKEEKN